ncbi:hypothetical protein [Acetivibrio cellulolyticus]|uniref:hypothetical protein n=1 Tax=Acetivibrio cellulolyticus TaxID=35830 RepID=UPI0001E2FB74|nr:hypothetical protein [Acetivibrio cellulolyticus]
MKNRMLKSIKQWAGILTAIISYYIVHEGTHLLLALLFGVFERVRFVGIWGIQIVINDRGLEGISMALFSGLSSIVTILIGYILAFSPYVCKLKSRSILISLYYITLCFMILDPIYISVLSLFVGGGGDLNGITFGLQTSDIPFRIIFGSIAILNIILFYKRVSKQYKIIFN